MYGGGEEVRTGSFRFVIVQCTLSLEVRLAVKDRPGTTSKPNKESYPSSICTPSTLKLDPIFYLSNLLDISKTIGIILH